MKTKRILSIILALVLTLSAIPFGGMISSYAKTIEEYSVWDIIEFGSYPQSKVTNTSLISSLDSISKSWISYGYYSGTGDRADGQMTAKDYMKYADISYGGNKYRVVKFTSYRPCLTGYTCSSDNSYQDDNGYYTNNVYYFKYETLKWRILDPAEGYVMCESIIDSQTFNNYMYYNGNNYYSNSSCTYYASDYANCSIRQWLNNDFYNTAFSSSGKSKIVTAEYENKSTWDSEYDSTTTYDKITLLSYWDAVNSNYGFSSSYSTYDTARRAQGTDYAKCQGLWVNTGSSYNGNSYWRLRSPSHSIGTRSVDYDGNVCNYYNTYNTYGGVRPAFKFNPKSIIPDCEHLNTEHKVEPSTCTKKGAEYDFCKDCKDAINYVELPLAAHTPGNWEQTVAPKCTVKGQEVKKCTVCKEIVETQEISATGHTPGEWKVTVEPTRDTEGARTNYCAICREFIKTEIIPKLNDLVSLSLPKDFEVNYKTSKNLSPKIDAKSYDYTVSYTSSNEAVATVDGKGNVKGISTGEATITCTVTDKYGNTLTDSTNVTVSLAWWQWLIKILLFGWIWY